MAACFAQQGMVGPRRLAYETICLEGDSKKNAQHRAANMKSLGQTTKKSHMSQQ